MQPIQNLLPLWKPVFRKDGTKDPYCIRSACGTWSVCLIVLSGVKTYELFRKDERIGSWATPEAAKAAARE